MKLIAVVATVLAIIAGVYSDDLPELDWWETTVFYQIYPRSFMDSDGDGIGDLNGITSKLEHLKELGIGATWLSPMFQSPMYDFGYDIADFYSVHDEYGTMEDFENLLAKAKELDIKIVLDFVPNHSSNESVWFEKSLDASSSFADWFVWEDGLIDEDGNRQPPNNWVSVFRKSAWEFRPERNQYYLHQFVVGQPDLNYNNEAVVEEMKNVISFWLEKGVAGFRIDAVNHLFEVDKALYGGRYPDEPLTGTPGQGPDDYGYVDHIYTKDQDETYDMVYQWRKVFDEFTAKDGVTRVMMTEAYASIKDTIRYYGDETSVGSHMPFNFGLISDADGTSSAQDIKFITDRWITYKPLDKRANWVIGNHDQSRFASRYGSELVDGLNMLVLLLPGVGVTYMGEEIGMVDGMISWEETKDPQACNTDDPINYYASSRDPERTPFQWSDDKNAGFSTADKTWLPVAAGYESLNVESQKLASRSHLKVYQSIVSLRQEPSFRHGTHNSLALNDNVFAFERAYDGYDTYFVVLNLGSDEQTVDLTHFKGVPEHLEVVISSVFSTKNVGDHVHGDSLQLDAKEALVLKAL